MIRSPRPTLLRPLLALAVALVCVSPAHAEPAKWPAPLVGAQFRYWVFDDHNDLRDPIVYWINGPLVVQVEYWDWLAPQSEDHVRPEVHYRMKDSRRSVYDIGWRGEYHRSRFMLSTDQILSEHVVGRAELDPIIWADSAQVVAMVGADYYWGSYNFASAGIIRDPRSGGLWSFPLRMRLASEANDWFQFTLVPTTDRAIGWAADGKVRFLRFGVERNSRYDFTNRDNIIFTFGVEAPLERHKE